MPKMKTKKALAKRVKVTGTGKLNRGRKAMNQHRAHGKTQKRKRHLRHGATINHSDYKRVRTLLGM